LKLVTATKAEVDNSHKIFYFVVTAIVFWHNF